MEDDLNGRPLNVSSLGGRVWVTVQSGLWRVWVTVQSGLRQVWVKDSLGSGSLGSGNMSYGKSGLRQSGLCCSTGVLKNIEISKIVCRQCPFCSVHKLVARQTQDKDIKGAEEMF